MMIRYSFFLITIYFIGFKGYCQSLILSTETEKPVSYATVSFGNGFGTFADDQGYFIFNEKLYPSIDSLYITALGFKEIKYASSELPEKIMMQVERSELDEVVISVKLNRPYKEEIQNPYLDNDYHKSWLPTIESEIAVFFENEDDKLKKITKVHFPVTLESKDWRKRKKANSDKRSFSTLFKVKFYSNENGFPGDNLTNEVIVFRATEKMGDVHVLDISEYGVMIPKQGVFVSLQVLGYTDKNGRLLPNKKFKEIKTARGIIRIPTNFRPLLPFTDEIKADKTFIKRVFINGNKWVKFNQENVFDSSLLKMGLNNYGMGMSYNVYKDE